MKKIIIIVFIVLVLMVLPYLLSTIVIELAILSDNFRHQIYLPNSNLESKFIILKKMISRANVERYDEISIVYLHIIEEIEKDQVASLSKEKVDVLNTAFKCLETISWNVRDIEDIRHRHNRIINLNK